MVLRRAPKPSKGWAGLNWTFFTFPSLAIYQVYRFLKPKPKNFDFDYAQRMKFKLSIFYLITTMTGGMYFYLKEDDDKGVDSEINKLILMTSPKTLEKDGKVIYRYKFDGFKLVSSEDITDRVLKGHDQIEKNRERLNQE